MKQLAAIKTMVVVVTLWTLLVLGISQWVGDDKPKFQPKPPVAEKVTQDIHVETVRIAESAGDQEAVSPVGAIGSMQVMPATADDPGFGVAPAKKNVDGSYNLDDIDRLGADYLKAMMKRYNNDFEAALIAYNAGPGNADKWTLNGRDYDLLPDRVQTEAYVERAYTNYFHLLAVAA